MSAGAKRVSPALGLDPEARNEGYVDYLNLACVDGCAEICTAKFENMQAIDLAEDVQHTKCSCAAGFFSLHRSCE